MKTFVLVMALGICLMARSASAQDRAATRIVAGVTLVGSIAIPVAFAAMALSQREEPWTIGYVIALGVMGGIHAGVGIREIAGGAAELSRRRAHWSIGIAPIAGGGMIAGVVTW